MATKSESISSIISTEPPIPTAASSSSAPPWTELPDDLAANILQRLGAEEILESAQLVCSQWWRVCKDPAMWSVIDLDSRRCTAKKFESICRCAVDRSQGQLIDLKLAYFNGNGLPNYVSTRSSQLRCMTLAYCDTTRTAVTGAIKKLPLLEELHLIMANKLEPEDCETIGISCPMLKSFTYNICCHEELEWDDTVVVPITMHAVVIGKTMPNLRHLRLCEQHIGNKGLEAILDGCPHLESLDLGGCSGLDLQGALGKRCSDQIKDLRLHSETSDSYRYFRWLIEQLECCEIE